MGTDKNRGETCIHIASGNFRGRRHYGRSVQTKQHFSRRRRSRRLWGFPLFFSKRKKSPPPGKKKQKKKTLQPARAFAPLGRLTVIYSNAKRSLPPRHKTTKIKEISLIL